MVYKFQNKINRVNLIHFTFQVMWLAAFIFTLPEDLTNSELSLRLLISFGGYTLLAFGLRHLYVQHAVQEIQTRLHITETSMHRLLGLFDDFSGLAEAHLETLKRADNSQHIRECLIFQADEMALRLDKASSDVEKMKQHLHYVYIAKPGKEKPVTQLKRQFESTYYYR